MSRLLAAATFFHLAGGLSLQTSSSDAPKGKLAPSSPERAAFAVSEMGKAVCPAGYRRISSLISCEAAAAALNNTNHTAEVHGPSHCRPSGCVFSGAGSELVFHSGSNGGSSCCGCKALCEEDRPPLKLFCFVWTARMPYEEEVRPVAVKELAKCDGHAIFSDTHAGPLDPGVVNVDVPKQSPSMPDVGKQGWLYHRNMAGLIPAWTWMFEKNLEKQYDWFINVELDHLVRPKQIRQGIEGYMDILRTSEDKKYRESVGKAMMLWWGNVFVFNKPMVTEMKEQWSFLGHTYPVGSHAPGCPSWRKNMKFCEQDMVYPDMINRMKPKPAVYLQTPYGDKAGRFPAMIWDMVQAPKELNKMGLTLAQQQEKVIRAIAKQPPNAHVPGYANNWLKTMNMSVATVLANTTHERAWGGELVTEQRMLGIGYPGSDIALIHHVIYSSTHELGQQLLM